MTTILAGAHHRFITVGEEFWYPEGDPRLHLVGSVLAVWPEDANGFAIMTAIHTGDVRVTIRSREADPEIDYADWEDIDQMVFQTSAASLMVLTALGDGEMSENLIDSPGAYVVRCAARGRDAYFSRRDTPIESPEEYLLDVWPLTNERTAVLKISSTAGSELNTYFPHLRTEET